MLPFSTRADSRVLLLLRHFSHAEEIGNPFARRCLPQQGDIFIIQRHSLAMFAQQRGNAPWAWHHAADGSLRKGGLIMGHRANRSIVLVFVCFLLAGFVLTASAQMATGPIEPGA